MNLTIGKKILLGFGTIIILTALIGYYALSQLNHVYDITSAIEKDFRVMNLLQKVNASQDHMNILHERSLKAHFQRQQGLTSKDPILIQEEWQQKKEQTLLLMSQLKTTSETSAQKALSPQIQQHWEELAQNTNETITTLQTIINEVQVQFTLLNEGKFTQMATRQNELYNRRNIFDQLVRDSNQIVHNLINEGERRVATVHTEAKQSIVTTLFIVITIGCISCLFIHRSISSPLNAFAQTAARVGQGDLTQEVSVNTDDELGRLGKSLNNMIIGLKDVAKQSRAVTENLNSATAEILASAQQQASSTAEQASAVQQTSATLEEINESGAQISERAQQVAASAEATSAGTESGLQALQDMTEAMEAIREQAEAVAENIVNLSEKTQAIGAVIATVNDLSEQSNLLALNAAIEASSAGEDGRRFAVVANEMKNLADQAREATTQVGDILQDIQNGINTSVMLTEEAVKRVESGKQQSDTARTTVEQLASSIQESVNAFQQIVAGTNQQKIGVEQVTDALRNIGQATDQTVNSTEQLEKAAANINALSQQLQTAMERYRL